MDISVSSLIYRDPPVTKADLMRAQQMIAPVNYPSHIDKIEVSENAKALAIKIADQTSKSESVKETESKE
jgi:hypothetical protein